MKKRTKSDCYLEKARAKRANRALARRNSSSSRRYPRKKRDSPKYLRKNRGGLSYFDSLAGMGGNGKACESLVFKQYELPRKFSIIENPEQTLVAISKIAREANNLKLKKLHLDHSKVGTHDLGAELLLGVIASELKTKAKYRNRNFVLQGDLPSSERKKRLISSMGVIKKLGIAEQQINANEDGIEIFDFRGAKANNVNPGSEDRKNRCARLFVEHLNKCLSYNEKKMTDDAVQRLLDFVGEIIDNAERHSGQSKWYVCGYLDHRFDKDVEDELHFCEIVIYNIGKSIAETFLDLPQDSYAMSLVEPYVSAHEQDGLFGHSWSKEDLLTLVSLQSHISSKQLDEFSDHGQGSVDLIDFFQQVAQECAHELATHARMCIVSGKTHILFDGRYKLVRGQDGREVIAFNKENSLSTRPDSGCITHFKKAKFPGTMISIRFPLSSIHTEKTE